MLKYIVVIAILKVLCGMLQFRRNIPPYRTAPRGTAPGVNATLETVIPTVECQLSQPLQVATNMYCLVNFWSLRAKCRPLHSADRANASFATSLPPSWLKQFDPLIKASSIPAVQGDISPVHLVLTHVKK